MNDCPTLDLARRVLRITVVFGEEHTEERRYNDSLSRYSGGLGMHRTYETIVTPYTCHDHQGRIIHQGTYERGTVASPPTETEVFASLLQDARTIVAYDGLALDDDDAFTQWAREYDYDSDSLSAWRTWRTQHLLYASMRAKIASLDDLFEHVSGCEVCG